MDDNRDNSSSITRVSEPKYLHEQGISASSSVEKGKDGRNIGERDLKHNAKLLKQKNHALLAIIIAVFVLLYATTLVKLSA